MASNSADPYTRIEPVNSVGDIHNHATTSGSSWTERPTLEFDQLFVAQGQNGRLHALGGKRSPQVEGWSYLAAIAFPNTALVTPLWQAPLSPGNHSMGVSDDGWPGMAFSKSGLRQSHANVDGSGWTPRDIDSSHTADAIATTAGDDATVAAHLVYEHDLRIYRMHDDAYYAADQLAASAPTSLTAKSDGRGGAHICFVTDGNIMHVELAADGNETVTDFGAGEQCALDVDVSHNVHVFTRTGTTLRHGVR